MTAGPNGMVDLHHHILPGVDDGAADLETAIEMARLAIAAGIATVVATPHTLDGTYDVERDRAREAHGALATALAAAGVALEVRLAGEVHLHEDIPGLLRRDPAVSLDGQGRYLLLELPHHGPPPSLPDFLFRLAAQGTTPVIAHPERNLAVRKQPGLALEWQRVGALFQLTAGSLSGAFGEPIRDCARALLRAGAATIVASDAHSLHKRPPLVREAFAAVVDDCGEERARLLFETNPRRILAGEPTVPIEPDTPRRRGLFAALFR